MALTKVTGGGIKDGTITNDDISSTTVIGKSKLAVTPVATGSVSGLMSSTHKGKLDGIADNANNYTKPANEAISYITGLQSALDTKTTPGYVDTSIASLVDSSPATLNTLNELAAALGDDANHVTTMTNLIGTKLSINGGTLGDTTSAPLTLKRTGAGQDNIWNFQISHSNIGSASGSLNIYTTQNNADIGLRSSTSGNAQFILKSSGNVGIGTTTPGVTLDVAGNIRSIISGGIPTLYLNNGATQCDISNMSGDLQLDGATNIILRINGTTEAMRIKSNGNVGIGQTLPSQQLHIGDGVGPANIRLESSGSGSFLLLNDSSNVKCQKIGHINTTSDIQFALTNSANDVGVADIKMVIRSSGNVGIGTTAPSEKLHVEGSGLIDAYNTGAEEGIFFREGFSSSNKYNMGIMTYAHNGSSHDGITIGAYNGFSICTGSNARQERFKVHGSGNITISAYNGTAASPSESADWPTPALAIRTYDSYSRNSVMSFGYPGDGIYQTGDTVWNLRLSNITGGNAATSSSNTNLELLGPGKLIVGKLHVGATDETTKQQIGSMPSLIAINGGSLIDGQRLPFSTGWSTGYVTGNTVEEAVNTGTVWTSRSASAQALLTLMGRANVQHFVRSFEIRRVTAARASGGYTFYYQQVPYGRSWTVTTAAFVKWVSGPLPYGWWCNGLVADGNWHWCSQYSSGTNAHYLHSHPYLPANDGTPSVILVALPGSVDKRVDEPTEWQTFTETEF